MVHGEMNDLITLLIAVLVMCAEMHSIEKELIWVERGLGEYQGVLFHTALFIR